MPQIAIIVEFEAHAGKEDELAAILIDHAKGTRADEKGCLRFEVMRVIDNDGARVPNMLLLDELYADDAALAAHSASPRLAKFRTATAPLVANRRATRALVA
jgi:autoinducer 2-degrading protein